MRQLDGRLAPALAGPFWLGWPTFPMLSCTHQHGQKVGRAWERAGMLRNVPSNWCLLPSCQPARNPAGRPVFNASACHWISNPRAPPPNLSPSTRPSTKNVEIPPPLQMAAPNVGPCQAAATPLQERGWNSNQTPDSKAPTLHTSCHTPHLPSDKARANLGWVKPPSLGAFLWVRWG